MRSDFAARDRLEFKETYEYLSKLEIEFGGSSSHRRRRSRSRSTSRSRSDRALARALARVRRFARVGAAAVGNDEATVVRTPSRRWEHVCFGCGKTGRAVLRGGTCGEAWAEQKKKAKK